MNRSSLVRKLAGILAERFSVPVEATYDHYSSRQDIGWYLTWPDGPSEGVMRKQAATVARGLGGADAVSLKFRRVRTELAVVMAFVARVLPVPGTVKEVAWQAASIYEETEFPERCDRHVREMAEFVLARPGIRESYDESGLAIKYIAATGLNALRLDMWLATTGQQVEPPRVEAAVLSEELTRDLKRTVERIHAELIGGSEHRDDPRAQLLVAETVRQMLADVVDRQQRHIAAHALVDGVGLSSLSTMIGLAPRTLGMRWGKDLDSDLAPLTWLRDHACDWTAACVAAAQAVKLARGVHMVSEVRQDLWILERCGNAAHWRELVDTPEAARRLLAAISRSSPQDTEDALGCLKELLDSYDTAQPPGRRERALRRPASGASRRDAQG